MILLRLANLDLLDAGNPIHEDIKLKIIKVGYKILQQSAYSIHPVNWKWTEGKITLYSEQDSIMLKEAIELCKNNHVSDFFIKELESVLSFNQKLNDFIMSNLLEKKSIPLTAFMAIDFSKNFSNYIKYGIIPTQLISNTIAQIVIFENRNNISKKEQWEQLSDKAYEIWDKADELTKKINHTHFLHEVLITAFECLSYYAAIKILFQKAINLYKDNIGDEIPKDLWKEHQVVEEYRVWTFEIIAYGGYEYIRRTAWYSYTYFGDGTKDNYLACHMRALKDMRTSFNIFPTLLYQNFEKTFLTYIGDKEIDPKYSLYLRHLVEQLLLLSYYETFEDKKTFEAVLAPLNQTINPDIVKNEYTLFLEPFNYEIAISLRIIKDSLRISQILKSKNKEAYWYSSLGLFFANLGHFGEAKLYCEIALEKYSILDLYKSNKVELIKNRIDDLEERIIKENTAANKA